MHAPRHDAAEELAALAHGLAREARRRAALGRRRASGGALGATRAPAPEPGGRPAPPVAMSARPAAVERVPARRTAPAPAASSAPPAAAASAAPPQGAEPVASNAALAAASPDLATLASHVAACRACALCETRTRTVFGSGEGRAGVLFVGEAPGADEDRQGMPFVGASGRLLTDIITKGMGLDRARDVAICNLLKCRPPENRDPLPSEKERCRPWLARQLELWSPRLVIALGRHAACELLGVESSLGRLRGRVHERDGRRIVVTFHPSYLLRSPGEKKACWQDIQLAMRELGLPVPPRPAAP